MRGESNYTVRCSLPGICSQGSILNLGQPERMIRLNRGCLLVCKVEANGLRADVNSNIDDGLSYQISNVGTLGRRGRVLDTPPTLEVVPVRFGSN